MTTPPEGPVPTTQQLLARRNELVAEARRHAAAGDVEGLRAALRLIESTSTDPKTLEWTDPFLPQLLGQRRLVASFDPRRRPTEDEVVIIYGNYPHMFDNVVINNPIRRHVADFWSFRHDSVEHDPRWDGVDRIFIINAAERCDRYDAVLRELAMARAPFDRITRLEALRGEPQELAPGAPKEALGHIGCLRSHIAILRAARAADLRNTLVLEDDFCFTSDLEQHLDDLANFLGRRYDYLVCLLATSKHGAVIPYDDTLSRSFQVCTNTGAYFVSREGVERLLPLYEHALARLIETGSGQDWAADRCWAALQPTGRFFVFRRKFGFQVSSFSDIERSIQRNMD